MNIAVNLPPLKPIPKFFFDMDGVLVNFDKKFQEVMPGVKEEDDWLWEDLHKLCPDIYLEAEPMPDARQLWEYVTFYGIPHVLTAIPRRWSWPNVTKHKRQWMEKHFGLHHSNVLFGPYAEDKQFHCLQPHYVLIDDKAINIEQWKARGGIGILHTSTVNTIKELRAMGI